jgi:hypothetical protein
LFRQNYLRGGSWLLTPSKIIGIQINVIKIIKHHKNQPNTSCGDFIYPITLPSPNFLRIRTWMIHAHYGSK